MNDQAAEKTPDVQEEVAKTVEVSPALTPPGKQLTEAERLGIENIYLKMQNCQQAVQNCDMQKSMLVEQMRQLQTEMEARKKVLSDKYGVDIGRGTVKPDGTIVSAPPAGNGRS